MKRIVVVLVALVFLFGACITPPEVPIQHTQTPGPILTSLPSVRPTSTIDELQQASGGIAFCQVAPQKAPLGSSVNISAYRLPPNHPISIFIYYGPNEYVQLASDSITTDDNGYVNIDINVPIELPTEDWSRIGLIAQGPLGPVAEASCGIWPWTEVWLATYSAQQTEIYAPTSTVPPAQAAVTATQQAVHGQLDKYCIYTGQARGFQFSPNGQWAAVYCSLDTLEIVRIDETKSWEMSANALINPGGGYFVGVNRWSNDGTYAYIDFDPHTDGYWEPYHQGIVLYRLNLETGQISEVLPLVRSDWKFYSFAFSPNDRRLAYIVTDRSPVILKIVDIQTGHEQSFEFESKYNTGGAFLWSPDSQSVVFSITQYDPTIQEHVATSIVLCEWKRPLCTMLHTEDKDVLVPVKWVNDSIITLQVMYRDEMKFELNRVTGELKQLAP